MSKKIQPKSIVPNLPVRTVQYKSATVHFDTSGMQWYLTVEHKGVTLNAYGSLSYDETAFSLTNSLNYALFMLGLLDRHVRVAPAGLLGEDIYVQ